MVEPRENFARDVAPAVAKIVAGHFREAIPLLAQALFTMAAGPIGGALAAGTALLIGELIATSAERRMQQAEHNLMLEAERAGLVASHVVEALEAWRLRDAAALERLLGGAVRELGEAAGEHFLQTILVLREHGEVLHRIEQGQQQQGSQLGEVHSILIGGVSRDATGATSAEGLTLPQLAAACRAQVSEEIRVRVGRKYLPELCQPRPVEEEIRRFVTANASSEVQQLITVLDLSSAPQHPIALAALRDAITRSQAELALAPVLATVDPALARQLERLLQVVPVVRQSVFLICDKAGSGKTTLMCKLAEELQQPHALCVLLSCKLVLPASQRIDEIIADRLHSKLLELRQPGASLNRDELLAELPSLLDRTQTDLLVFLDGINEHRNLAALDDAILGLLQRWSGQRIRFIVTCRDIFWDYFSADQWRPFLYDGVHDLPALPLSKIDRVIAAYFDAYRIRGEITGRARERCCHPLILRFFCEAYRDTTVSRVEDLRLLDLFKTYWQGKCTEIATSLGFGRSGGFRVESFVMALVDRMAEQQATQVRLGEIGQLTGERDIDGEQSIYRRLLDEDVIFEELPPDEALDRSAGARRIAFVYDEFYDFMLATSYVHKHDWDGKSVEARCVDVLGLIGRSGEFEQLRGVIEYLVLMGEESGGDKAFHRELCALLAALGQHDLLRKVLPKLNPDDWMIDVLGACLHHVDRVRGSTSRRDASLELASAAASVLEPRATPDARALFDRLIVGAPT